MQMYNLVGRSQKGITNINKGIKMSDLELLYNLPCPERVCKISQNFSPK